MAEHTSSAPAELGAPMDYAEHERTYGGFLALTKITVLACVAILQALTLFGLASNGFWLGVILIVLMMAASVVGIISKGSVKALIGVVILGLVFMALALG